MDIIGNFKELREEYKKQHPINQYKRYSELKEKMKGEFRKISQNDEFNKSISQFIKLDIHFEDWKYLKTEVYSEGNSNEIIEFVEKNLSEFFDDYCSRNERYLKYDENCEEFANFLDMKLNSPTLNYEYWCFYLESYKPIFTIERQEYHEFIVIKIDSKILAYYFNFEDKIHPFIQFLKWQLPIKINLRNYDELYRRIVSDMDVFFSETINNLNQISLLKYEGKINNGVIIYSNEYDDVWNVSLKFENVIKLNEHRKIRKLLEVSSDKNALLLNQNFEAFAFGNIKNGKTNYRINFIEGLTWKVSKNNKDYIELIKLQPMLPSKESSDEEITQSLNKVFDNRNKVNKEKLLNIIKKVKQQKKGTMLVITENAEEESTRLSSCGIKVNPKEINDEIINLVTSIDGALLIDTEGVCHAIGVILDGDEIGQGDSSRGARYNSALRYFNRQQKENKKCLIVVVSEDRYINSIPEYKE